MLTQSMFEIFTAAVRGQPRLFVAVGAGQHRTQRGLIRLADEVARKAAETVDYLDPVGNVAQRPTPRLQVAVTFGESEAVGTLCECGLFGGAATAVPGSDTLLAYYAHEAVEKRAGTSLIRRIVIDLTSQGAAPGPAPGITARSLPRARTRWLGNSRTRELHDLDNLTPRCQIEEIARDRRYYFENVIASEALGYDLCAHCFGARKSRR